MPTNHNLTNITRHLDNTNQAYTAHITNPTNPGHNIITLFSNGMLIYRSDTPHRSMSDTVRDSILDAVRTGDDTYTPPTLSTGDRPLSNDEIIEHAHDLHVRINLDNPVSAAAPGRHLAITAAEIVGTTSISPTTRYTFGDIDTALDWLNTGTLTGTENITLDLVEMLNRTDKTTLVGVTLGDPDKATIEATLQSITVTWNGGTFTRPVSLGTHETILAAMLRHRDTGDEHPLQEARLATAAAQPELVSANILTHFAFDFGLPLLAIHFRSVFGTVLMSTDTATRNGRHIVPDGGWNVWSWPIA